MKYIYIFLTAIFKTTTALLKIFNFCLLIILILCGSIKVISGVR